ncbi:MFS transporter [Robiginitomaculum antarcticum]|uniref:MFS transporter n=1 Tax=Robiginitomaculum antarcticum TaxID=437507 RepID=UPI000476AC93
MERGARFSSFRHSAFRRYFAARFITACSTQILATVVAFEIWEVTRSAAMLGMIGLVQFLPALLLVMVTGLAADKLGRRAVMGTSIGVEMLCALSILALALTGNFRAVPVLGVLVIFGTARAFFSPASSSLVVNLVPKPDFANAIGWVTLTWQLASIIGPAIGGVLHLLSAKLAFGISGVLFAVSMTLIFSIPKPEQSYETKANSWHTLTEGFRYIWKTKIVLGAISLDLFAVLLGGAVALLPIYADEILNIGKLGNGLLRAAPGVGAVTMIGLLLIFPIRDHAGKILFVTVGLFGLATAVFGISALPWLSVLALIAVGAFDMISVYIREILLQLWTPDNVRGRVNAVNSIFLGASNELGEARAGFMAARLGAILTVAGGGVAAIGVAGLWAYLFPDLRNARRLEKEE